MKKAMRNKMRELQVSSSEIPREDRIGKTSTSKGDFLYEPASLKSSNSHNVRNDCL